ncbi:CpaE family protein [Asticcacaulis sp. AND118]|uniref:AAA family ATPase n=1 Tax=Asticcacaulis sp. AND118 TaxID=2840468 RepID=UPI001CFF8EAE|nr:CpaE family protein [Asticcacaulis sp. AND118]UDF03746.1 AAA family ATPase [Asticcacaulis sp. AND118]
MSANTRQTDPFDSFDDADDGFTQNYEAADALDLGDPFEDLPEDGFDLLTPQEGLQRQALTPASFVPGETGAAELLGDELGAVSIPRIGIHFFPDAETTLHACDTAALDRRMARAQSLVRRGGIEEAIAAYQHEPTPSLLIVESHQQAHGLLDQLGRLAEVCDANTKVVVIGAHNDISLYRELIRQGVSEYLVAPVKPLQLIKSIATLFNDPETPFVGRAIAFIGARGGAGSSVLAHNFAHALSESMQANTVIADYDLPFGTAGLDFNQDPLQGMADALNEPDRLDPVLLDRMLTRCTERLSLFSAPASLDQDYLADEDAFEEVTRKVRSVAPFIVMDLPHIWTPWLKKSLIAADEVVIVATPDLASLRNAKNLIELLKSFRPNDNPPRIVLNQVDMPGRPEIPVKDFTAALGIAPSCTIAFDAKTFGQAANNGQMIAECAPGSKTHEALLSLTAAITGRTPEPKKKAGSASLLGKFFPKKK